MFRVFLLAFWFFLGCTVTAWADELDPALADGACDFGHVLTDPDCQDGVEQVESDPHEIYGCPTDPAGNPVPDCVYIEQTDPLSPDDFYRAVTCGAEPGGQCRVKALRFDRAVITAGICEFEGTEYKVLGLADSLYQVADLINNVGAGITARVKEENPCAADIIITSAANRVDSGVRSRLSQNAGFWNVHWQNAGGHRAITRAVVWIDPQFTQLQIMPLLTHEVVQAMGFGFDLAGPNYYDGRKGLTIFPEGDVVWGTWTGFKPLDVAAFLRHYPPQTAPSLSPRPAPRPEAAEPTLSIEPNK